MTPPGMTQGEAISLPGVRPNRWLEKPNLL
jgi:hypothetical protein